MLAARSLLEPVVDSRGTSAGGLWRLQFSISTCASRSVVKISNLRIADALRSSISDPERMPSLNLSCIAGRVVER